MLVCGVKVGTAHHCRGISILMRSDAELIAFAHRDRAAVSEAKRD